jgi:hypothetical protein
VNELSPVFHQFLDATYQLLYQHPSRFEFNERFLRRLLYHLYSCQYGTFLFDNEKERVEARAAERTRSVWDYFLCRKQEFTNPNYDPVVDDSIRGKERMIFPKKGEARWWAGFFGRADDEMNTFGPQAPANALSPRTSNVSSPPNGHSGTSTPVQQEPIVTGTESAENATGAGTVESPMPPTHAYPNASTPGKASSGSTATPLDAAAAFSRDLGQNLAAGIANLGLGGARGASPAASRSRSRSTEVRKEMEVEMQ